MVIFYMSVGIDRKRKLIQLFKEFNSLVLEFLLKTLSSI